MPRYFALIPAAGTGSRTGDSTPKQYLPIDGRPMLWHALQAFLHHPCIERMFVVLSPGDTWFAAGAWDDCSAKLEVLQCGGKSRAESVLNGLRAIADRVGAEDQVLVHDAARPCLTPELIDRLIDQVGDERAGGLLAQPVSDTIKRADAAGRILATESREDLWQAQTPQMFRHGLLLQALSAGNADGVTDEAGAIERLGLKPKLVKSDASNLKVTYAADLGLAEAILNSR